MVMCPHCFATNQEDVKFCVNCGMLIKEDGQSYLEDYVLEEGLEKWRNKKNESSY